MITDELKKTLKQLDELQEQINETIFALQKRYIAIEELKKQLNKKVI